MIQCRTIEGGVIEYHEEAIARAVKESPYAVETCPHGLPKVILTNRVICPACERAKNPKAGKP
jgi:hypothetical protein